MKHQYLLIVFVKNIIFGKVKTRLASTIGHEAALKVYDELVKITEQETRKVNATRHIYFSETIVPYIWKDDEKFIQKGPDLGARMMYAFLHGFEQGYNRVIVVGSDLPNITKEIIEYGFEQLKTNDIVLGPATDGGYYLLGMSRIHPLIFENKPWSKSTLLGATLQQLAKQDKTVALLSPMNDVDTYEDLVASNFCKTNQTINKIMNTQQLVIERLKNQGAE